ERRPSAGSEASAPDNAAPVLDSDKKGRRGERAGRDRNDARAGNRNDDAARRQPAAEAGPPPRSDAASQRFREPVRVESADAVKGRRIEGDRPVRRAPPSGTDIVKEIGDRLILNLGGQTIVQGSDNSRLRRGASDVYYEELPQD